MFIVTRNETPVIESATGREFFSGDFHKAYEFALDEAKAEAAVDNSELRKFPEEGHVTFESSEEGLVTYSVKTIL